MTNQYNNRTIAAYVADVETAHAAFVAADAANRWQPFGAFIAAANAALDGLRDYRRSMFGRAVYHLTDFLNADERIDALDRAVRETMNVPVDTDRERGHANDRRMNGRTK